MTKCPIFGKLLELVSAVEKIPGIAVLWWPRTANLKFRVLKVFCFIFDICFILICNY